MKRLALPLLVLALGACSGASSDESGERTRDPGTVEASPADASFDVDVAVIRSVGDLPPRARRVDIRIDAAGAVRLDGADVDLDGLRAGLGERAGPLGGANPVDIDALLILHRDLPWKAAQAVMQECAVARLGRIFFAVRHVDGGEGAVAAFLPLDVASVPTREEVAERAKVVVRVRRGAGMSAAAGLESLLGAAGEGVATAVEIDADPATPVGLVLELVDAAAVAGAHSLTFVGTPLPAQGFDLSAAVAGLREQPARFVTVNGQPLTAAPGAAVSPERVTGAYAGFAAHPSSGVELEDELEIEEPDER